MPIRKIYIYLIKVPYLTINIIFAGIIILVIGYSCFFSAEKNNYIIKSTYENKITKPPSYGLSRSFSAIVRLDFEKANKQNKNGMEIFLFFLIQLFLRITFLIIYLKKRAVHNKLIIIDALTSIFLFVVAFYQLISFTFISNF